MTMKSLCIVYITNCILWTLSDNKAYLMLSYLIWYYSWLCIYTRMNWLTMIIKTTFEYEITWQIAIKYNHHSSTSVQYIVWHLALLTHIIVTAEAIQMWTVWKTIHPHERPPRAHPCSTQSGPSLMSQLR